MAISQNFPEEGPTLNLNFAGSRTLDPRITFTRTSSATYMGRDGLVKIAPANSARFDHRYNSTTGEVESLGLLVEEARTNLLLRSEEFDSGSWISVRASISPNVILSPDGNLTADKLVENTATDNHFTRQATSTTLLDNTVYTFSVYAKAAERTTLCLVVRTKNNQFPTSYFNLINGTVGGTSGGMTTTIQNVGNGWYRCSVSQNMQSGATNPEFFILTSTGTSIQNYTGDGTSGLFLWGAQLEEGSFPTSYIPTTTSTATRTADNARIIGSNLESWFNSNEGTFLINHQWNYFSSISINPIFAVSTNGGPSGINLFNVISGNGLEYPATSNYVKITTSSFSKYGLTYNTSSRATILNGGPVVEDANGFTLLSTVNRLSIGSERFFAVNGVKTIQQLTYYPQRLSNSQLITLTK